MTISNDLNLSETIALLAQKGDSHLNYRTYFKINKFIFALSYYGASYREKNTYSVFNDKGELMFIEYCDKIFLHWSKKESYCKIKDG